MTIGRHAALQRLVLFEVRLTAKTGFHIGAGKSLDTSSSDLPVVRDGVGRPYVPGSSLRGILRTGVEMLVKTLGLQPPKDDSGEPPNDFSEKFSKLGVVERMFGRVAERSGDFSYASRLTISDAACAKLDSPLEVRDGVAIARETRTAAGGAKFNLEVVPAGTQFRGRVRFKNPEPHELGLLAQSLWMLDEGILQLGGGSARGLGWMSVECGEPRDLSVQQVVARTSPPSEIDFGPVEDRLATYLQALDEFVTPKAE